MLFVDLPTYNTEELPPVFSPVVSFSCEDEDLNQGFFALHLEHYDKQSKTDA